MAYSRRTFLPSVGNWEWERLQRYERFEELHGNLQRAL